MILSIGRQRFSYICRPFVCRPNICCLNDFWPKMCSLLNGQSKVFKIVREIPLKYLLHFWYLLRIKWKPKNETYILAGFPRLLWKLRMGNLKGSMSFGQKALSWHRFIQHPSYLANTYHVWLTCIIFGQHISYLFNIYHMCIIFGHICLIHIIFVQHIYLFDTYHIWSTGIIFGRHRSYLVDTYHIWSTCIIYGQHISYLVNLYHICLTHIIFVWHISYLVDTYHIWSTHIIFGQHISYLVDTYHIWPTHTHTT
jgi:hypothetical protein